MSGGDWLDPVAAQLDHLDAEAARVAVDQARDYGVMSTGERLYVALAANRADLLEADGYTIAEAVARLDEGWMAELVRRWQYRGDPRKAGR